MKHLVLFSRLFVVAAALLITVFTPQSPVPGDNCGAVSTDKTAVRIFTKRDGEVTHFYVKNLELSEVTMTFDFSVVNLKADVQFPYTATFKPGETQAFVLSPADPEIPWQYSFTNYYKLGSSVAQPDGFVYSLPYAPGATYRVSQGYDGRFSHKGSNKYAIDWKMPEGTPVCAARGGLVVKVKDDSNTGGSNIRFDPFNNYVIIRHDDGTLGHYCHLKQGGVKVVPGSTVRAGEMIALSGNTGFSSGPHLHFCVFKAANGRERESIPVKFHDPTGESITLTEGRRYKSVATPDTKATVAHGIPAVAGNANSGSGL